MLRAAGRDRAHSRNWQRPGFLELRGGSGGLNSAGPLWPWEGLCSLFLELWETIAGFAAGADMARWNTDWRDKVDVGRPERRQLQYPGRCGYLV